MSLHDLYPDSRAFRGLPPLRIPGGWTVAMNDLCEGVEAGPAVPGPPSPLFLAWHEGRRFRLEVALDGEAPEGPTFILTVTYQPWPRTERGRRRHDVPFAFDDAAETVETCRTRDYPDLIAALEHRIARCTHWVREGN